MTPPATTASSWPAKAERRGQVLEVLRELLAEGRSDEVLALVTKLLARNTELERKLADMLSRGRKNEGISSAQLLLMLEGLGAAPQEALEAANRELRAAAALEKDETAEPAPPKKQPPLRRPLPPGLRRVVNPIAVPEAERACPQCGGNRECIGHERTEVIDLVPAEVIVRVDEREKLACRACEAEVVRAPTGDKVVAAGRMGTTLVG
jgi:transposase